MIRTLTKVGIEGTSLSIIKAIYDKPTANIILSEMLKGFPLKSEIRYACSLSPLLFNIVLVQATEISKEKGIKGIQIGREEVTLSLHTDDMVPYMVSKVARYKINIQKSVAFLYANNEISEKESEKQYVLKLHQKNKNKIHRNKPDQGGERLIC